MDSIKLLPRNGKLMAFVVVLSMIMYSSLSSLFTYLIELLAFNMITHSMPDPSSFNANDPASFTPESGFNPVLNPHFKKDVALTLAVEITSVPAMFLALFISTLSIIVVASASYKAQSISLNEFFSSIWRTWSRALATYLYVLMFVFVYFVGFFMVAAPFLMYNTPTTLTIAGILATVAFGLFLYVSIPWTLAIVVAVVDKTSSGFDALGKAGVLIKGKRAHGFFLNIVCFVVSMITVVVCRMSLMDKWLLHHMAVYGFLVNSLLFLAKFFLVVAYTVLFFQTKKIHGEEVELYGNAIEYAKIPITDQKG